MADIKDISLDVKGTLSMFDPDSPTSIIKVVYQATSEQFANYHTKTGKPRMVRAYVAVVNPGTPAQLARQEAMRQAVANWHTATSEERDLAKTLAESRNITLYMAYISLQLKSLNPVLGTIWDGGATTWDSGTTLWDI